MQQDNGWKMVNKGKKQKKKQDFPQPMIGKQEAESRNSPNSFTPSFGKAESGDDIKLPYNYVLWCHDIYNKDWNLSGYTKLYTVTNVSEFWRLFNNFDKLHPKTNNFFFMREGIDPIWEHPDNRNGGMCSFRMEMDTAPKIYEDLCVRMICDKLTGNANDINGVSFSPKNNWAILKIWNKDRTNDLSKTLDEYVLKAYSGFTIKYKENEPEY
jgi:translation initiation factor 4E